MILFHTTFHVSNDIYEAGLSYFRTVYILAALRGGQLHAPRLQRVMHDEEHEGISLSMQFQVADLHTLQDWMSREGTRLQQEIRTQFGDRIVGFSTLLEELDLTPETP